MDMPGMVTPAFRALERRRVRLHVREVGRHDSRDSDPIGCSDGVDLWGGRRRQGGTLGLQLVHEVQDVTG